MSLKPRPSSRFFFTRSAGSAADFLASPPGSLNLPSGPLQETNKNGTKIIIKKRLILCGISI